MSNSLEYKPFPQDETLASDTRFGRMVGAWYGLINEIADDGLDDGEVKAIVSLEIIPDLMADAQEFFPDRDPRSLVILARWEASNLYQMKIEAEQKGRAQDV
ncbi:MAG TPA: hypothetical protein VMT23_02605 [Candidatus Binatia bacterium]|nr:hypothetical protein [Candidatus Binatia bacterium]